MCHAYTEEYLGNGDSRVVLKLPECLAPVKCAVFPLDKKDGLPEIAHAIVDDLKFHFNTHYGDPKDSIGKRYRRQDAVARPFCVTVDHGHAQRPQSDAAFPRYHGAGARRPRPVALNHRGPREHHLGAQEARQGDCGLDK
jgi:hypothetical protein